MAIKRFACSDCGVKYTTKSRLTEHMKSHISRSKVKKSYACKTCSNVFTSPVILKRHQNSCQRVAQDKDCTEGFKTDNDILCDDLIKESKDNSIEKMVNKMQTLLDSPKKTLKTLSPTKSLDLLLKNKTSVSIENMRETLLIKNSLKSDKTPISSDTSNLTISKCSARRSMTRSQSNASKLIAPISKVSKKSNIGSNRSSKSVRKKRTPKSSAGNTITTSNIIDMNENNIDAIDENGENSFENVEKSAMNKHQITSIKIECIDPSEKENDTYIESSVTEQELAETENSDELEKTKASEVNGILSPDAKKQFTCAQCSKHFSRKYHLDRHLKLSPCSGLPPLSFPCQVCNRVYSRKDNLREHLRQHTGESQRVKKHRCGFCNKSFHGQSLLTIHIRTHTGERPFACDFCSKKFPSVGALSKHRRTHTGEKPFVCTECGHRFSLKGTLKRHLRVHSGVRPHKCSFCAKEFIQIGGLKAHMFYHTGENGFKCEQCGKVFNRKARLQMHKLYVHVKLRPFICEHCPKSFTRKEDLNRHSVLHTGERPFKCPTCCKTFAIKPSLKLHLLVHTKEEPRSCHECGRAFIRKDCLLRHMRKRHRDLLDKILLDEKKDEKFGETNTANSRMLKEEDLCENITELLSLLVEESTLLGFGWPNKPVDEVLEAVIRRCGHTPVDADQYTYMDRMRENAKLLFTVVIDDNAVKTLLNNQTVDEVILHVLRLAKT